MRFRRRFGLNFIFQILAALLGVPLGGPGRLFGLAAHLFLIHRRRFVRAALGFRPVFISQLAGIFLRLSLGLVFQIFAALLCSLLDGSG